MFFQISGWPMRSKAPCYTAAHLRVAGRCTGIALGCLGQAVPQLVPLCTCTVLKKPHEESLMQRSTGCNALLSVSGYLKCKE